jgi:hypothetical protein
MFELTLWFGAQNGKAAENLVDFISRVERACNPTRATNLSCRCVIHGRFDFGVFHFVSILGSICGKQFTA